jgi:hypothetical protein
MPSFLEIERSNYEFRVNALITFIGKIVLTAMRFQLLSHIMNIPQLRTYITCFIQIHRTNYELQENVLITSRGKILLIAMSFQ